MTDTAKLIVKYGEHAAMVELTKAWEDTKTSALAMVIAEARDFATLNVNLKTEHAQWMEAIKSFEVDILDSVLFDALIKVGNSSGNATETSLKRYIRRAKATIVCLWDNPEAKGGIKAMEDKGNDLLDTANEGKPVKGYTAGARRRSKAKAEAEKAKADKAKEKAKLAQAEADQKAGITRAKHVLNVTALLALKVKAEKMLANSKATKMALSLAGDMVKFADDVLTPVNTD